MNSSLIIQASAFPKGLGFATQNHFWCAFIGETPRRRGIRRGAMDRIGDKCELKSS